MILGITGSFGSGKTTVAKMFEQLGAYVIDADKVSHSLMMPGKKVYKKIVRHFGKNILRKDRTIDNKKLALIVFRQRSKLNLLNRLVHPEAISEIQRIIHRDKKKVIVVDAALLVESGFYKKMDKIIIVKTDTDKQINRIVSSKHITKRDVVDRIRMQAPLRKKAALADFIIDNSKTKKETKPQVLKIWRTIRSEI